MVYTPQWLIRKGGGITFNPCNKLRWVAKHGACRPSERTRVFLYRFLSQQTFKVSYRVHCICPLSHGRYGWQSPVAWNTSLAAARKRHKTSFLTDLKGPGSMDKRATWGEGWIEVAISLQYSLKICFQNLFMRAAPPDMQYGAFRSMTPPARIWYRCIRVVDSRRASIPSGHQFKSFFLIFSNYGEFLG